MVGWMVEKPQQISEVLWEVDVVIIGEMAGRQIIARVAGTTEKSCRQHAQIVAAAPELLATLKLVQDWANEQDIAIPLNCKVRETIAHAELTMVSQDNGCV